MEQNQNGTPFNGAGNAYNPGTQNPNYTAPPYGNNAQQGQSAYTNGQNPNTAYQNPYANGQAQNGAYQNPYVNRQNPNGAYQNPYANGQNPQYGAQNPAGGYRPQNNYGAYNPQNAYNPQYGYYSTGYYCPQKPDPFAEEKKQEKKTLKRLSTIHGLSLLGFSLFAFVLSYLMISLIPNFRDLYQNNDLFHTAIDVGFGAIVLFVPFFIGYTVLKKKKLIGELPLHAPYNAKAATLLVFIGLAACLAGSYASGILNTLLETVFQVEFKMPPDDIALVSVPVILLSFVKVAIVPAIVEEFAIRGVVMQSLKKYGDWFAILMSAMVFALMHGNMVQIPFAFIAGIAIGYAVTITGSMWTGVLIHCANNALALTLQILEDNLTQTVANMVGLILIAAVFAAGIICLILYIVNYKKIPLAKGEGHLTNGTRAKSYILTVAMVLAILYLLVETAQNIEW